MSSGPAAVRMPADVDRPDRLLAGLTARQLGILAAAAVCTWTVATVLGRWLAAPLAFAAAAPPAMVGVALALGQRDGLSLDRLALAALRYQRAPRVHVPAPDGIATAAGRAAGRRQPSPLRLPARAVGAHGVIDLGGDGAAVVLEATPVQLGLRSPAEQQALLAGFARMLHAVEVPVQFLVRTEPVDLAARVRQLEQAAPSLPHPALEQAAREHARFLAEVASRRDVLRRRILLVLRDPARGAAAATLAHRAEQASSLLAGIGVGCRRLGREQTLEVLAGALDPHARRQRPGMLAPDAIVSGPPA